jgi:hypothetical protein
MRSSSFSSFCIRLASFGAVGALLVTASGCRIEAHTQTQFEDSTQPAKTSTKDWNGEAITINNGGVNPVTGSSGVEVNFSATATKITAQAVFAAHADDDKEADAKAAIKDAVGTFVIEETATGFNIKCGHGSSHGSASVSGSGCKKITVTLPAGSATQALDLTVGGGNGDINVSTSGGDAPFVKNLIVDNNGTGDVNVRARPVKDGVVVITGEFAVAVALPSDFSAGKVLFTTNDSDPVKANARVHTDAFPGMVSGSSYPVAGATADAAASLNVQSKGLLDDDTVTITKF